MLGVLLDHRHPVLGQGRGHSERGIHYLPTIVTATTATNTTTNTAATAAAATVGRLLGCVGAAESAERPDSRRPAAAVSESVRLVRRMAYEALLLLAFCVSSLYLVWGLSNELWKCELDDLSRPVLNIGLRWKMLTIVRRDD